MNANKFSIQSDQVKDVKGISVIEMTMKYIVR